LDQLSKLVAGGKPAALATVVRISGSAYRRPGAKLLIEGSGFTYGGVSGGCLESDVRAQGLEVLRGAPPRMLHYDTGSDEETLWGLGLGCGGAVEVSVQRGALARTCTPRAPPPPGKPDPAESCASGSTRATPSPSSPASAVRWRAARS